MVKLYLGQNLILKTMFRKFWVDINFFEWYCDAQNRATFLVCHFSCNPHGYVPCALASRLFQSRDKPRRTGAKVLKRDPYGCSARPRRFVGKQQGGRVLLPVWYNPPCTYDSSNWYLLDPCQIKVAWPPDMSLCVVHREILIWTPKSRHWAYDGGHPKFSHFNRKKSQCSPNYATTPTTYDNKLNAEIAR